MVSVQAAQLVKKNATKIRARKASARANSTFVLAVDTPPMEARTAEVIPCDGERWQYEPKWDGFRCLAFKSGDAIDLLAKSGKPLGRYFPEIVSLLRDISVSPAIGTRPRNGSATRDMGQRTASLRSVWTTRTSRVSGR